MTTSPNSESLGVLSPLTGPPLELTALPGCFFAYGSSSIHCGCAEGSMLQKQPTSCSCSFGNQASPFFCG